MRCAQQRYVVFILPLITALAGCATTHGTQLSAQELQGRVLHLETLAEQRDQELSQVREELEAERTAREALEHRLGGGPTTASTAATSGGLTIREVQLALQRAGFPPGGAIDGKMGKQTRAALRKFQEAHGLMADGRIGPQTIAKLKPYLTTTAPTAGEK